MSAIILKGVIYLDYKKSLLLGIKFIKFVLMESEIKGMSVEQIPKLKESIINIYDDPVMQTAIDVLSTLGKHKEITLRAKGKSISNAVTVALIITGTLQKGNSKISKITVDSEPIQEMGEMYSTIEIILKKN